MATFEQEESEKMALSTILSELSTVDPKDLVRSDELGSALNFEGGLIYFERTLKLFHNLAESNLDNVPYQVINKLKSSATEVNSQVEKILQFSPTESNPISTRDSLIVNFRDS